MTNNENIIPTVTELRAWFENNPNETSLVRTCKIMGNKLISSYDFEWPTTLFTEVHAPDWNPDPVCGQGLHGLIPGQQDPGVWWETGAHLLVSADRNTLVSLEGNTKSKAPRMTVLAIAYNNGATLIPQLIRQLGYTYPVYKAVIVDMTEDVDISVGDYGVATAGDHSHAKASHYGVAKVGDYSIATVGNFGLANAGYASQAISGSQGRSAAASHSTAIAGYMGVAIAGLYGKAKTGKLGTSMASVGGQAAAGEDGSIQVRYVTGDSYVYHPGRIGKTLDINGNPLLPNTYYKIEVIDEIPQWVAA
jgi:hypothetical protein